MRIGNVACEPQRPSWKRRRNWSDRVRHPLAPLDSKIRTGLLELARQFDPLALHWGKQESYVLANRH